MPPPTAATGHPPTAATPSSSDDNNNTMVLVQHGGGALGPPNPTLQGHKLLVALPHGRPAHLDDEVAALQRAYPGLAVQVVGRKSDVTRDEWAAVTLLLAGYSEESLPDKDDVPRLQYVQLSSAGANAVVGHPLFTDTDVAFCTANGVHGPQISEWIIATFLAFQHQIPAYLDQQKQGKWQRSDVMTPDAVQQRVGILGYGAIGRQTARVATAMGMEVYAYTLHARPTPASRRDTGYTPAGLGDPDGRFPARWFAGGSTAALHAFLGAGLDLLVVALPLTARTAGLIGAPELAVLARHRTFVCNVARGPIVDTAALIDALDAERIRGAALDVTDPEPLPDGHPLFFAKNVIVTPHISGVSTRYYDRVWDIVKLNLAHISKGEELVNRVNRKEGY